jgi:hypothetical protein
MPHSGDVVKVLRAYIRAAVPAYQRSERTFWLCACLPAGEHETEHWYARVNIAGCDGCAALLVDGQPEFRFYAALSPLKMGRALLELFAAYPGLELTADATYLRGEPQPLATQIYDRLLDNPHARITQVCARELADHLPTFFRAHPYLSIAHDQTGNTADCARFTVRQSANALALLHDGEFRRMLRVYALALVRKGHCRSDHAHCPALADELITPWTHRS